MIRKALAKTASPKNWSLPAPLPELSNIELLERARPTLYVSVVVVRPVEADQ